MTLKIEPVAYYDQENGGQVPIFKPTYEEFKDFKAFTQSIDPYGRKAGIVKIIPPPEWKENLSKCTRNLDGINIIKPITQHILGGRGLFIQTNIESRKNFKVDEWFNLCRKIEHRPPKINHDSNKHRNSRDNATQPALHSDNTAVATDNKRKSANLTPPAIADHSMYESETSHLSVEQYKEYERNYWRNITYNQALYGADMLGTLFDSSMEHWNPNTLDNLLNTMQETLPGVNRPYLYFGMWKATFPWHVEDLDLYSINYIHFGAPKQWYTIPTAYSQKFEKFMQNTFYQQYKDCHEFLRHKTFIVSPTVLEDNNIPVQRCVQQPGEFIITYPFGYHAGYNLDFNCAESVNFATEAWLDIGKRAKRCICLDDDTVRIDIASLLEQQNNSSKRERNSDCIIEHADHVQKRNNEEKSKRKKRRKVMAVGKENSGIKACKLCSSIEAITMIPSADDNDSFVHQLCAEAVPEVFIKDKVAYGMVQIPKSRWKLTCVICKKKTGACVQCCFEKCYKPVHATCVTSTNGTLETLPNCDPSTQQSLHNVYCPLHDPVRIAERQKQQQQALQELCRKFQSSQDIYIKWTGGACEKGIIKECIPDKRMCRVLLPDGLVRKIRWTYLSFEPPQQQTLPRLF